ncbi:MAG TPA: Gfo/Idh/MocA family oxidoreductase [Acidobacteriota bacterium]|nr:Gfo/Idh/MocA family oxidoreductase [Acidobacteriota bacterium]HRV09537.1 Gfo/Idh/MocA family oxidoreductase [Acidobacteriota bacterium]
MNNDLHIGVIGYGYWGPNIVRNFMGHSDCAVTMICDAGSEALDRARRMYPGVTLVKEPNEVLDSPDVDAVAVVTPVATHYELARRALENGKHVFVEKPFTANSDEAKRLVELAEAKGRLIMVDHTFLFTGAVRKIKQLIEQDSLGKLLYYDSTRVNLGLFQHDVNVVWDLAPHDLSILDHLVPGTPEALVATGTTHFSGYEDVAYITVYYPDSMIAHFNVNWLSPVKIRMTLVGGEKRMLVWNDLEPDEKIKLYDKGVDVQSRGDVYNLLISYRSGDMVAPRVEPVEALQLETRYFLDCIRENKKPRNGGEAGLRIVRMLEAAEESLKHRGKLVEL